MVSLDEAYLRALGELEFAQNRLIDAVKAYDAFLAELDADLRDYVGRPSPVYHANRWSRELRGAQIFLKREDSYYDD